MRLYLKRDYEKLYLIDIICHGVPSQRYLHDEVKRLNNKNLRVDRVNFRDKAFDEYTFSIVKDNRNIYAENWVTNPYLYAFKTGIINRDNCYQCQYATSKRGSDITIGDFWGLSTSSKFYRKRNEGVSVILIQTQKGKELFKKIQEHIDFEERYISEAVEGNTQLRRSVEPNKKVKQFKKVYRKKKNFYKTYKRVFWKHYCKEKLKKTKLVKKLKMRNEIRNGEK